MRKVMHKKQKFCNRKSQKKAWFKRAVHLAHRREDGWGDVGGVGGAGPVGLKYFAVGCVEGDPDVLSVRVNDHEGALAAAVMGQAELGDEVFADCRDGRGDGVGFEFDPLGGG